MMEIYVLDPSGFQIEDPTKEVTGPNGTFISSLSDLSLDGGRYRILVKPISGEDQNLSSTAYLDVTNDVLTTDEFIKLSGTYIGVIAPVVGLIALLPRLKSYYSLRTQRRNLVTQLEDINNMYDGIYSASFNPLYNKQVISERL